MTAAQWLVLAVLACAACNDESTPAVPAGSADSAGSASVASAMPLGSIHLEPAKGSERHFIIDHDTLVQVLVLSHLGRLPVSALPNGEGYRVLNAPAGSVIDRAGLRVGDEVTRVNGARFEPGALEHAYRMLQSLREVVLTVRRGGEELLFKYELAAETPPALDGGAEGDGGVTKVTEYRYDIKRSRVQALLENQATLMREARVVPEQENGKVVGVRLFGIRKTSVLAELGFENGDRVRRVNGFLIVDPSTALEAYAELKKAKEIVVELDRKGKPVKLQYRIID
jgi:S1-C subfamily serine protease